MVDVTMRQMLEAGVHFGHQTRYWSPRMAPHIYGERNKIHIFNLETSLPALTDAANYLGSVAARNGGRVLFVGTKRAARDPLREAAESCGMPFVNRRWSGGMMTNFKTVKGSVKRLLELEAMEADGSMARLSKKEALGLSREHEKLERGMGGIKHMERLPDALFIVDVGHERIAVAEANKLGIPVVAVVDSNNSPEGVDYVIPGNDDAIRAIQLYCGVIAGAIRDARRASGKLDETEAAAADAANAAAAQAQSDAAPAVTGDPAAAAAAEVEVAAAASAPAESAPASTADAPAADAPAAAVPVSAPEAPPAEAAPVSAPEAPPANAPAPADAPAGTTEAAKPQVPASPPAS